VTVPSTVPTGPGEVERAVRAQCASAPRAEQMPGIVAMAIRLARQLDSDDRNYMAMSPQLAAKLDVLLSRLEAPKKKSGGRRLASVQAMSGRKPDRVAQ
jgi:hypothetical protein